MNNKEYNEFILKAVRDSSPKCAEILEAEMKRQDENIELIASENFPSPAAMAACGSIMSCKYTEGYPKYKIDGNSGRYYGGCDNYDELELYGLGIFRRLFDTSYYFNLQPHSGSNANCIAYSAVLKPGDTILSMDLSAGGHLTHSSGASFVSKLYKVITYGTDENGFIDYDDIRSKAHIHRPKAIICGASAYPRIIDFKKFREIADEVDAYLIADIAHVAGLVISGDHPSPFGYAHIVTFTSQKTFRSIRGGIVACIPELAKAVDSSCFPRWQGGSIQNAIMGKVISAEEALKPEYKDYIHQVVLNTKAMCNEFIRLGFDVVTCGTDNHLFLLDFSKTHPELTGKMVQDTLDTYKITVNKNCVPNEKRSPKEASGVRIGCAAMTTKGWTEEDAVKCADRIAEIINGL